MVSRSIALATILSATGLAGLHAQTPYQPHAYADDFGIEAPIIAPDNSALNPLIATYYGWEATTVFGNSMYAMTVEQYNIDLTNGCFAFYSTNRAACGSMLGQVLFDAPNGGKSYNDPVVCPNPSQVCYGNPFSTPFTFTPGTEIVLALRVDQGIDGSLHTPDYNWFFSGDPTRNTVADDRVDPASLPASPSLLPGLSHLAFWPDGVGGNKGQPPPVPGTIGLGLFGWEDTGWHSSDWDFDNAIFSLSFTPPGVPETTITPEPATMTLLATGLSGLALLSQRRRRQKVPTA